MVLDTESGNPAERGAEAETFQQWSDKQPCLGPKRWGSFADYSYEDAYNAGVAAGRAAQREQRWMTPEAFEWMDRAVGLSAELHGALKALIPNPNSLSDEDRGNWQVVVDTILKSASHADAMPQVLKDRARKPVAAAIRKGQER